MMLLIAVLVFSQSLFAQVPVKPSIPLAVNDYASLFRNSDKAQLERTLEEFSRETSNRIVIVTVKDLGGMTASEFAFELGEKWGVGSGKFDNGIVVLVKPKTISSRGEAFIAVGYGLEGAIPDIIAKRIVEKEMIPYFKQNNYMGGVVEAVKVLMPMIRGEIDHKEYQSQGSGVSGGFGSILFLMLLVLLTLFGGGRGTRNMGSRNGSSTLLNLFLLTSILGGGRSGGGFGGSSGGGFSGGFGGGSFGGGGAGGSW